MQCIDWLPQTGVFIPKQDFRLHKVHRTAYRIETRKTSRRQISSLTCIVKEQETITIRHIIINSKTIKLPYSSVYVALYEVNTAIIHGFQFKYHILFVLLVKA